MSIDLNDALTKDPATRSWMDITLEKVELVKDRMGCSYAEAKWALEKADGSVVDAIIEIEGKNTINGCSDNIDIITANDTLVSKHNNSSLLEAGPDDKAKRKKCVICKKEFDTADLCCPSCRYPIFSLSTNCDIQLPGIWKHRLLQNNDNTGSLVQLLVSDESNKEFGCLLKLEEEKGLTVNIETVAEIVGRMRMDISDKNKSMSNMLKLLISNELMDPTKALDLFESLMSSEIKASEKKVKKGTYSNNGGIVGESFCFGTINGVKIIWICIGETDEDILLLSKRSFGKENYGKSVQFCKSFPDRCLSSSEVRMVGNSRCRLLSKDEAMSSIDVFNTVISRGRESDKGEGWWLRKNGGDGRIMTYSGEIVEEISKEKASYDIRPSIWVKKSFLNKLKNSRNTKKNRHILSG